MLNLCVDIMWWYMDNTVNVDICSYDIDWSFHEIVFFFYEKGFFKHVKQSDFFHLYRSVCSATCPRFTITWVTMYGTITLFMVTICL